MNKKQLAARLAELAASEFSRKLARGAMCYSTTKDTGVVDVVCTSCNQKSIHPRGPRVRELDECKRLIQSVNTLVEDLQFSLDTAEFCRKCSGIDFSKVAYGPGTTPSLFLNVQNENGTKTRKPVSAASLRDLLALIKGQDVGATETGSEYPLKERVESLRRLLDISS